MRPDDERITIQITSEVDVAHARREARQLAGRHGFGTLQAYGLATAVSELATNLVFHTSRGGTLSLIARTDRVTPTIDVIAEDDGPGIDDIDLAMRDGYSTRGGLGCGLPGTRRLVDDFAITSVRGQGTRVVCAVRRT